MKQKKEAKEEEDRLASDKAEQDRAELARKLEESERRAEDRQSKIEEMLSTFTSKLEAQNIDSDAIENVEKAARAIAHRDDPRAQDAIKQVLQGEEDKGFDALESLAAQNDSQARQQRAEIDDTIAKTVEFWIEIGDLTFLNHTYRALNAYEKAIALNDTHKHAWNQIGQLHYRLGELARAEAANQRVLALSENDAAFQADALKNMGNVAKTRGDLDNAMDYYTQSNTLNKELGSKQGMARNLNNMGLVAEQRHNIPEACRLWTQARDLYAEISARPQLERVQGWLDEAGCEVK